MRIASLLMLALLALTASPRMSNSPAAASSVTADEQASTAPPKLRRLHLVRPDLIYYPFPSEYLC
jgi:hypothetical protein